MPDAPSDNQGRRFRSEASAHPAAILRQVESVSLPFRPLPHPTGTYPFHLDLKQLLPPSAVAAIHSAGKLVFHCVGDTGGINQSDFQHIVANHMDADCADPILADCPRFFYHLGDIVYFYGAADQYYAQFYEPYAHYPAPILGVPGNHDGDLAPGSSSASLQAFVENFCAKSPLLTPESGDTQRDAMTQPNVYWTLDTEFLTLVGLYTNVPEGGRVDATQKVWLIDQLKSAPTDRALLLAMHHPILSLDKFHSGSLAMHDLVEEAVQAAGRHPDMVLAGHVHNYQRFTRTWGSGAYPFIVAGAGGYHNLHYMNPQLPRPIPLPFPAPTPLTPGMQATLDAFNDDHHGYLVLEVDATRIKGDYFTVPQPQESWSASAVNVDSFAYNWHTHTPEAPGPARAPAVVPGPASRRQPA